MMNENKGVFGLNMLSWWDREGNLDRVTEPLMAISRRAAWSRWSPRRSPSTAPARRTNSSPSAATSARSCCSLNRVSDRPGRIDAAMKKAILIATTLLAAWTADDRPCRRTAAHRAARRRHRSERDQHLAQPRRPQLRDRLDRRRSKSAATSAGTRQGIGNELICEAAAIGGFEVNAGGGDDSVIVAREVPIPVTLRGGPGQRQAGRRGGDDKLVGGDRRRHADRPRRRRLSVRRARQTIALIGGSGNDLLHGGTGDDTLLGGSGRNELCS